MEAGMRGYVLKDMVDTAVVRATRNIHPRPTIRYPKHKVFEPAFAEEYVNAEGN